MINNEKEEKHPFIQYLESLVDRGDRSALAAMRRGLGTAPGSAPEMFRYVVPWLPEKLYREKESAYYLTAALFAYHPQVTKSGNMGAHMAQTGDPGGDNNATERRFTALLASHPEDLPVYLRQAVSFLKSKDVAVNWQQLFVDLQQWSHPRGYVQKNWAKSFWGRSPRQVEETDTPTRTE